MIEIVRQARSGGGPRQLRAYRGETGPALDSDARIDAIEAGLRRVEGVSFPDLTQTDRCEDELLDLCLRAAHDEPYLDRLVRQCAALASGAQDFEHDLTCPGVELDTPLVPEAFALAREGSRTALTAVARAAQGPAGAVGYALCRPPGHHAGPGWLGGYCFLNHAAAAVAGWRSRGLRRVAVLDIDFHYGNGTAAILRSDADALFCSVHADTRDAYPYTTEEASPQARSVAFREPPDAAAYVGAVRQFVAEAQLFRAQALVVSVGFDVIHGDPHGGWSLQPSVFAEVGAALGAFPGRQSWVQEGGYDVEQVGDCARQLVTGFCRSRVGGRSSILEMEADNAE